MRFTKLAVFTITMLFSVVASATIWLAGSGHSGKVLTPLGNDVNIAWQCDGKKCLSNSTKVNSPMQNCQQLVKKIGKITYFTDNKGTMWSPVGNHDKLKQCNRSNQQ